MNSLVTAAFARELEILVNGLKARGDPCVGRFLPFYSPETLRQVTDHWNTINCLRQELAGVQASLQQLSSLVIAQTQQLSHPSSCQNFTLHTVEPVAFPFEPVPPAAPRAKASKPRAKKKPTAGAPEIASTVSPPAENSAPPAQKVASPSVSDSAPQESTPPKKKKKSSKRPLEQRDAVAPNIQVILPPVEQVTNWQDHFMNFTSSPRDAFNFSDLLKMH